MPYLEREGSWLDVAGQHLIGCLVHLYLAGHPATQHNQDLCPTSQGCDALPVLHMPFTVCGCIWYMCYDMHPVTAAPAWPLG